MIFDEFDASMRIYEKSLDQILLPDTYLVARIDGRSFTRLTKEICHFEVPFDIKFRNYMLTTVEHLMNCGFRIIYGFTESDEISLLFHPKEQSFGRKVRKYNSILAGEASAAFSLALGQIACFDCRIVPLPTKEKIIDYFLWRQEDAHRNALNSYCYWTLRKEGISASEATNQLSGQSIAFKNELLFQRGINFNQIPLWQKRGIGIYWDIYQKSGLNPSTQQQQISTRRRLKTNVELPIKQEYANMLLDLFDLNIES